MHAETISEGENPPELDSDESVPLSASNATARPRVEEAPVKPDGGTESPETPCPWDNYFTSLCQFSTLCSFIWTLPGGVLAMELHMPMCSMLSVQAMACMAVTEEVENLRQEQDVVQDDDSYSEAAASQKHCRHGFGRQWLSCWQCHIEGHGKPVQPPRTPTEAVSEDYSLCNMEGAVVYVTSFYSIVMMPTLDYGSVSANQLETDEQAPLPDMLSQLLDRIRSTFSGSGDFIFNSNALTMAHTLDDKARTLDEEVHMLGGEVYTLNEEACTLDRSHTLNEAYTFNDGYVSAPRCDDGLVEVCGLDVGVHILNVNEFRTCPFNVDKFVLLSPTSSASSRQSTYRAQPRWLFHSAEADLAHRRMQMVTAVVEKYSAARKAARKTRDVIYGATGRKKRDERAELRQQRAAMKAAETQQTGPSRPPRPAFSKDEEESIGTSVRPPPKTAEKTIIRKKSETVHILAVKTVAKNSATLTAKVPADLRGDASHVPDISAIDMYDDDNAPSSGEDHYTEDELDELDANDDDDLNGLDDKAIRAALDAERVHMSQADASSEEEYVGKGNDEVATDEEFEMAVEAASAAHHASSKSRQSSAPPPTSESDALDVESEEEREAFALQQSAAVKQKLKKSLARKRLHHQVDADADTDDHEEETHSVSSSHVVPAAAPAKKRSRRQEAVKAEVPQWTSDDALADSSAVDSNVLKSRRKMVNDEDEQKWPEFVRLANPRGAADIGKCEQGVEINILLDYTIAAVEADIVFSHAFPEHGRKVPYQRDVLVAALHDPEIPIDKAKCEEFEHRLSVDLNFVKHLGKIVGACIPLFCGIVYQHGVTAIAAFQLGVGEDCKERVSSLLAENKYIHPGRWNGNMWVKLSKDQPYSCKPLLDIMASFFADGKAIGRNPRYAKNFLDPEDNEEHLEIPKEMIALAATVLHSNLNNWKEGKQKAIAFTGNFYSSIYDAHIMTLSRMRTKNATWYHGLVSAIYDKLKMKNTDMETTAEQMLAGIDIPE
ncbi:hypothetical protein FISHEDRAFT_57760 [Fistulina hepatica ATCC 64428]|uniref:DUF6532 domain-containing protein n=1 Tax=Fistulina hepatica ATCC 64428 TaxID=1128425 RepID=A0A0D7AFF2_9AGAR|nr:hypothetical protein FISHEDRAFT_57760 [Fistulina hepatica ATCC 64428]